MESKKSTLVTDQILKKSLTIFGNFTSLHHCPPNSLSVHASFDAYVYIYIFFFFLHTFGPCVPAADPRDSRTIFIDLVLRFTLPSQWSQ